MKTTVKHLSDTFFDAFGTTATHIVQAPGRVNLIGEHTDYNDGFVLPCAIDFKTIVAISAREDNVVHVVALDYGDETDEFSLEDDIGLVEDKSWANYIRGVISCILSRGYQLSGMNIAVTGNVPQGAGLSSSAALEVAIGQAVKELFQLDISGVDIALIGQQAESEFVGCSCGIMDQMISVDGKEGYAVLLDCRSLERVSVPIPEGLTIVIINSNKRRELVDSEYNSRREQCQEAAEYFGVKALRDVTFDMLNDSAGDLDPLVFRRARHVVTENARTLDAVEALKAADIGKISKLMEASHASMRDDFEITVDEVDTLVSIISEVLGDKGGVRMTGGGFGGCVVALVPDNLVDRVVDAVDEQYQTLTGYKESFYVCFPRQGAGLVSDL